MSVSMPDTCTGLKQTCPHSELLWWNISFYASKSSFRMFTDIKQTDRTVTWQHLF